MSDTLGKKVEIAANISIIVIALVGTISLISNAISNAPRSYGTAEGLGQVMPTSAMAQPSTPSPTAGSQISLPGVIWGPDERALVMILSTNCHFCSESAPFYQRLTEKARERGGIRLIAALPQGIVDSKKYLQDLKLVVDEVIQVQPKIIGVRGTPTLLLVDQMGIVQKTWLGRLPPEKESEVLALL